MLFPFLTKWLGNRYDVVKGISVEAHFIPPTCSIKLYHYTMIIVVCLSVCLFVHLSIAEIQRKRFDLETQEAISLAIER